MLLLNGHLIFQSPATIQTLPPVGEVEMGLADPLEIEVTLEDELLTIEIEVCE